MCTDCLGETVVMRVRYDEAKLDDMASCGKEKVKSELHLF